MMIPKNSRNRRKHLSNHSNDSTASSSQKQLREKALPTITRTSNHNSNHSSDCYSNSLNENDSACSWVELDFLQTTNEEQTSKDGKPTKPVSSVNIAMDLVDDEESKSSNTSNLSEDLTDKGDIPKGNDNGNRNAVDDDDDSVTSFASDSYAGDIPFDDLLDQSLRKSNSELEAEIRKEAKDELPEMANKGINVSTKPMSFRSDTKPTSDRSAKPASERSSNTSKAKKQSTKKHSSPKAKTRKKSKSPGTIQARKRLQQNSSENNNGDSTEEVKEHKKKSSRRRHGQVPPPPPPPPPPPEEENEALADESSIKKKISSKPTKSSSSASGVTRRRRLRSSDAADETSTGHFEDEANEPLVVPKDGSNRSLGSKARKQERNQEGSNRSLEGKPRKASRTRAKSKSKHRKAPSRSISNPDSASAAAAKREIRKRYKKKTSGHDSDEDNTENQETSGTTKLRSASRSRNREGKKKIRSKSTDEKKLARTSDGRRRRKKRTSKPSEMDADVAPEEDTQKLLESPLSPNPDAEDGKESDAPLQSMTYSFHFRSDDDDKDKDGDNWLNSANSSSSSLSYNSFAQFSLDVGDMSGLVSDMANLIGESNPKCDNSVGIIPDLDASVQTFSTNISGNLDASVVFMAGKSSKVSLMSHSFDHGEDCDDGNGKSGRSARSVPTGSSDGLRPEKQLRRRLKKNEGDGNGNSKINSENKKKVRRAKSGGLERVKDSLLVGAARSGVQRTKSQSEALVPGTSKLIVSSAKKQERHEKSRRKKEKSSSSVSSSKPKHAGKSKSAHIRDLSASPQINFNRGNPAVQTDLFESGEMVYEERAISLNDVANDDTQSPLRTPKSRSPGRRQVRRTFSNPNPSNHLNLTQNQLLISPMSHGTASPASYNNENPTKARRPSPSRQALLSRSSDDYDSDESGKDYSPHSTKKRGFLPKRGLERTPSALLAGVRNHFRENPSNMLSKMKKTFSKKDLFQTDFDDISIGLTTEKGYIGAKERRRMLTESAGRRGQVKNSLYACMSDSDSSVEISSEIFDDNGSDDGSGGRGKNGSGSVASYNPTKTDNSNREKSGPRRVNSLPIGIRRSPNS